MKDRIEEGKGLDFKTRASMEAFYTLWEEAKNAMNATGDPPAIIKHAVSHWMLTFHKVANPPSTAGVYLVSDGQSLVRIANWTGSIWRNGLGEELTDLIAWSHLPHPSACLHGIMEA